MTSRNSSPCKSINLPNGLLGVMVNREIPTSTPCFSRILLTESTALYNNNYCRVCISELWRISRISWRITLHRCKISSLSCHHSCPFKGHCNTPSGQQFLNGTEYERANGPMVMCPLPPLLCCKVRPLIQCSILLAVMSVY